MTELAFDTETTGLEIAQGHRIVEIGIVEVDGFSRTGRRFQKYINPMRPVSEKAYEVHGLGDDFLKNKPTFDQIADELLEFIGDSTLVVHNAEFDIPFLNSELHRSNGKDIGMNRVVDTLDIARQKLSHVRSHSMNALCKHFNIDSSSRTKHGALIDADLLVEVYFALKGTGKNMLDLLEAKAVEENTQPRWTPGKRAVQLPPQVSEDEDQAHRNFVATLGENSIWSQYL